MDGQIKFEDRRWSEHDQKIQNRHKFALDFITRGRVIDIGCGDGLFLKLLKEKGVEGVGVDFSEVGIKKCHEAGLEASVLNVSQEKLPFTDSCFDYAAILDVLEHTHHPEDVLAEAARVSHRLILSVPNFNSLAARWQMLRGLIPENNKSNKGHIFWFNEKVLKNLLDKQGLRIIDWRTNTVWEGKPVIGGIMIYLLKLFPSLFALQFVVLAEKKAC